MDGRPRHVQGVPAQSTRSRHVCAATHIMAYEIRNAKKEARAMPVSDDFTKLKKQVEEADQSIREAAAKNQAELKQMVDEARTKAETRSGELHAKSEEAAGQVEGQWNEVQSTWDQHIKRLRERVDAKKAAVDADMAEQDAEWSEAEATDAVEFASAAIEEARYAVLDAVLTRRDADVMAASK